MGDEAGPFEIPRYFLKACPVWSGEKTDEGTPSEFLTQMNAMFTTQGINQDHVKVCVTKGQLRDLAKDMVMADLTLRNPAITWNDFRVRFLALFAHLERAQAGALTDLFAIKQNEGEPVAKYALRFRKLAKAAIDFGQDPALREQRETDANTGILLVRYLAGLHDTLRREVVSRSPENLDAAVAESLRQERWIKQYNLAPGPQAAVLALQAPRVSAQPSSRNGQGQATPGQRPGPSANRGQGQVFRNTQHPHQQPQRERYVAGRFCNYCNLNSHWVYECRSLKRAFPDLTLHPNNSAAGQPQSSVAQRPVAAQHQHRGPSGQGGGFRRPITPPVVAQTEFAPGYGDAQWAQDNPELYAALLSSIPLSRGN